MKDGVWIAATLHHIIVVHKNKAKLKAHKAKQDGKSEVKKVDDEAEDEREEEKVPLKRKWQGEEEVLELKREKSSKAKDSKDTLPSTSTMSPKKKNPRKSPSSVKSKSYKATNSQTSINLLPPTKPAKINR